MAGGKVPISLTLNDEFIEIFRSRATVADVDFFVDPAYDKPDPPSKDGDLHVAGRSPQIELPMVAELMNARAHRPLVTALNDTEDSPTPMKLSGVWRVWPEYEGLERQIRFQRVEPAESTNPEHLFEIHPITRIGDTDVVDTLRVTSGYKYKVADVAFQRYESAPFELDCEGSTTTLRMKMVEFSYVDFAIELLEDPTRFTADGLSLFAKIPTPKDEEILVFKRWIWFVKDARPINNVRNLQEGDRLQVIGIPRISLSLIGWRCEHAEEAPEVPGWGLPYEMMAVGVL